MTAKIGVIGLGVMGANLALNIASKKHCVAVFNRTAEQTKEFYSQAPQELQKYILPCEDIRSFIASIAQPRPIILMIPAGTIVDEQIDILQPYLCAQDIIIDAGNADFNDTKRRSNRLKESNIRFIGMGVSGGKEGARHGPSIMAGGDYSAWKEIEEICADIAAKYNHIPCSAFVGPAGAGHFVKTIHNGIEYADMQMISEIYGILRDGLGLSAPAISGIFDQWSHGALHSYLIKITADILKTYDHNSNKPIVDIIMDTASQKGTGQWSAIEAQRLGAPASCIEAAVSARLMSMMRTQRIQGETIYGSTQKNIFDKNNTVLIQQLESTLLAGKILAYTQGFMVLQAASKKFEWNLSLSTIASIWRAGCIISSQLLDQMTHIFSQDNYIDLLIEPSFVKMLQETHPSLRYITAKAILAELPVPALSAALAYFDTYKKGRGFSNLVQAQRDFFGAHSFERLDVEGQHHGPWSL